MDLLVADRKGKGRRAGSIVNMQTRPSVHRLFVDSGGY